MDTMRDNVLVHTWLQTTNYTYGETKGTSTPSTHTTVTHDWLQTLVWDTDGKIATQCAQRCTCCCQVVVSIRFDVFPFSIVYSLLTRQQLPMNNECIGAPTQKKFPNIREIIEEIQRWTRLVLAQLRFATHTEKMLSYHRTHICARETFSGGISLLCVLFQWLEARKWAGSLWKTASIANHTLGSF